MSVLAVSARVLVHYGKSMHRLVQRLALVAIGF